MRQTQPQWIARARESPRAIARLRWIFSSSPFSSPSRSSPPCWIAPSLLRKCCATPDSTQSGASYLYESNARRVAVRDDQRAANRTRERARPTDPTAQKKTEEAQHAPTASNGWHRATPAICGWIVRSCVVDGYSCVTLHSYSYVEEDHVDGSQVRVEADRACVEVNVLALGGQSRSRGVPRAPENARRSCELRRGGARATPPSSPPPW